MVKVKMEKVIDYVVTAGHSSHYQVGNEFPVEAPDRHSSAVQSGLIGKGTKFIGKLSLDWSGLFIALVCGSVFLFILVATWR